MTVLFLGPNRVLLTHVVIGPQDEFMRWHADLKQQNANCLNVETLADAHRALHSTDGPFQIVVLEGSLTRPMTTREIFNYVLMRAARCYPKDGTSEQQPRRD